MCLDASYADFYNFSLNLERKQADGVMDKTSKNQAEKISNKFWS